MEYNDSNVIMKVKYIFRVYTTNPYHSIERRCIKKASSIVN